MAQGYKFPVDRTAIMLFASALGETNRIYYDEDYAKKTPLGQVIAPPTFAISSSHWDPSYALRGVRRIPAAPSTPEQPGRASGAGENAGARKGGGEGFDLTRLLHGEQRFEYHQPMRPGMELTVTTRPGRTWEKQGRRGGKLRFSEGIAEYRDADGELVVTATSVAIATEKAVES